MNKLFSITLLLLCLSVTKVSAGWYECFNFKGHIGTYPITLSMQNREGYFGEKSKRNFNLIGIYKYDKFNTPIRLEGKLDKVSNKAILYETVNNAHTAVFEFSFSERGCTGVWRSSKETKQSLPLTLNFVSKIADLNTGSAFSNIDVLQFESLPAFYFVANYSKIKGHDQAQMKNLKIIRKKDNSLYQTLSLENVEAQTGNVMTIIYDNVTVIDEKRKTLGVSANIGKDINPLTISYNSKSGRFYFDRSGVE